MNLFANIAAQELKKQILILNQKPSPEIQAIALSQLNLAKKALEQASSVSWYEGLATRWVNNLRWKSYANMIQEAEESYTRALKNTNDLEKKKSLIYSWNVAQTAVELIAKEAKFGSTDFLTVITPITELVNDTYQETAKLIGNTSRLIITGLVIVGGFILYERNKR